MLTLKFKLVSFLFFHCINTYYCNEPHCSKFHYEEALLEKMIRLEIKFEQMAKEYEDMAKLITADRQKLGEDKERMTENMEKYLHDSRGELDTLKTNIETTRDLILKESQDMKSSLETTLDDNEAKLARLSQDVNQHMNETLNKLSDLVKVPEVFFQVKDLVHTSRSTNRIVLFKTEVDNIGHGYDIGSGVFTAPNDGVYFFTAQFCVNSNYAYPSFFVDEVETKVMAVYAKNPGCSTMNLLLRLKTGSRVSIRIKSGSNFHDDTYRWNTFTGILLRKTLLCSPDYHAVAVCSSALTKSWMVSCYQHYVPWTWMLEMV